MYNLQLTSYVLHREDETLYPIISGARQNVRSNHLSSSQCAQAREKIGVQMGRGEVKLFIERHDHLCRKSDESSKKATRTDK